MKMKALKLIPAAVIGASLMISMCACSKATIKTTESSVTLIITTETTATTVTTKAPETTAANEEPDTTDAGDSTKDTTDENKVRLDIGAALGFENCYCERDDEGAPFYIWNFYNTEGRCLGVQFGYGYETSPKYFIKDLDGDGTSELICDCEFGGDGAQRTYIYRNNNGTIEQGMINEDIMIEKTGDTGLSAMYYAMHYDEAKGAVIFRHNDETDYELTLDDFSFAEYLPET